jgi:hypothetical protein
MLAARPALHDFLFSLTRVKGNKTKEFQECITSWVSPDLPILSSPSGRPLETSHVDFVLDVLLQGSHEMIHVTACLIQNNLVSDSIFKEGGCMLLFR